MGSKLRCLMWKKIRWIEYCGIVQGVLGACSCWMREVVFTFAGSVTEYLIKWMHKSYRHVAWIPAERVKVTASPSICLAGQVG